jgi:hypothetical protein
MLNTIVTSSNFKNFAKTLSRKSNPKIPLSKAHEIFAQTFSFKNHYELQKSFDNNSYVDIIIDNENHQLLAKRFCYILNRFEINLSEESSLALFISVFGLESNRKMSILDILNEINHIKNLPDTRMDRLSFLFTPLSFTKSYSTKINIALQYPKSYSHIIANNFKMTIEQLNKYKILYEHIIPNSESFLASINNLNPSLAVKERLVFLLSELVSYSRMELMEIFSSNKNQFLFCESENLYVLSRTLNKNEVVINFSLFEKDFLMVKKSYIKNETFETSIFNNMKYFYNSSFKEKSPKADKELRNALSNRIHVLRFENYDIAIESLSSQNDKNKKELVIVPIYRLKNNCEDRMTFVFDEYFGIEKKKIYQYSINSKTKTFL